MFGNGGFRYAKDFGGEPRSLSTRSNHNFARYLSSVRVGVHILVQRIVGYPGILAARWLRPLLKQGAKVPEGDCGGAPTGRMPARSLFIGFALCSVSTLRSLTRRKPCERSRCDAPRTWSWKANFQLKQGIA